VQTVTKGKALLTTTTGALPRPCWHTENRRGIPLPQDICRQVYRELYPRLRCKALHGAFGERLIG
jgi:5-methyltetrahydropteroyltriglutamate--homocysteine methyltransferase